MNQEKEFHSQAISTIEHSKISQNSSLQPCTLKLCHKVLDFLNLLSVGEKKFEVLRVGSDDEVGGVWLTGAHG